MAQLLHGYGHDASHAGVSDVNSATLVRRLSAWFAERRLRAETMRELSRLNPRDLADLSITPTDFEAIATGTWKR